jgi:ABC-type dipeptide/oligopeptide/nickel transport system permease component
VKLKVLPVAGIHDGLKSYLLPSLTLGIGSAAALGRLARSSILDNSAGEHIRAAIARGVPRRRVMIRHVLKNSLVPIVTIMGLDFAYLRGGAVITETVFNLPGIGKLAVTSIFNADFPMVMGITVFGSIFIVTANLVVDVAYAFLDPRVRYT